MPSIQNFTSGSIGFAAVAGTAGPESISRDEFINKAKDLLGISADNDGFRALLSALFDSRAGNDGLLQTLEWTSLLQSLGPSGVAVDNGREVQLTRQSFASGLMRYLNGPTIPGITMASADLKSLICSAFGMSNTAVTDNLFPDLDPPSPALTLSQIRSVISRVTDYQNFQLGGSLLTTLFGSSDLGAAVAKERFTTVLLSQGFSQTQAEQVWNDFLGGAGTTSVPLGKIMLALGTLSGQDGDANLTVKDLNLFQINYILGNASLGAENISFEQAYNLYLSGLCSREEAQQLFNRFAVDGVLSATERTSMFIALRGSGATVTANSVRSLLTGGSNTQGAVFAGAGRGDTTPLSFDQFAGANGTIERDEFVSRLRSRGYSEQMAGLLWQRFNTQGESMTAAEFNAMVTAIAGSDGIIQASDVMAWALGDMATAGKTFSKTEFADIFNGILSRDQLNQIFDSYCSSDGRLDASELRAILTNADGNSNSQLSMSELLTFSANLLYKTGEQSEIIGSLLSGLSDIENEMYALTQELQGEKNLANIARINVKLSQLAAMQTQITGAMGKYMEMVQNLSRPLQG